MNNTNAKVSLLLALITAQACVVIGSWLWSAAMPESAVRSLLSESGIRWFFGTFQANLARPLLVWIVLLDIAIGVARGSGMWDAIRRMTTGQTLTDANQRSGIRAALVVLLIEVVVMMLLTMPRQATLLSVTGRLYPSSFSESIVPTVAAACVTMSIAHGLFCGALHSYKDVMKCLWHGGSNLKTLLVFYVFAIELYFMVRYAFFS